jgi:glycosyltransferase involved in cell wall biosynthesis
MRPAIVIPAFNEAESVEAVLAEIKRVCDYPIFLVDDVSTDGTSKLARECGAIVLPLVSKLGAWGATQTGIRYALRCGHDAIITMDADGQHDPRYLGILIDPLDRGIADVCIGSCTTRGSIFRRFAWKLLRQASGIRIQDLTSGFRAYNFRASTELARWQATFLDFQDVGILSLLLYKDLSVVDTDTPMRARSSGHSRVFRSWLIVAYYMCHTLMLGVTKRRIRRYKPIVNIATDVS